MINSQRSRDDFHVNGAIVVASHPRSGTHLVIDLLRRQFPPCEPARTQFLLGREPYWNLDELFSGSGATAERQISRMASVARPVLKTHRRPDFAARCQYTNEIVPERATFAHAVMARATKIYIYRPVFNVMTSLYVMVHPQGEIPFTAFIREMRGPWSRVGWWAMHLSEWMRAERTLLVSYDELMRDSAVVLSRLGEFIGEKPLMRLPVLPRRPSSIHLERLRKLVPLRRDSTALMSYSRHTVCVRPTSEDLTFMREDAMRIDPRLPGLPDADFAPVHDGQSAGRDAGMAR